MDITSKKMEEVYQVVKYSFSYDDFQIDQQAYNTAVKFFTKYHPVETIRQSFLEVDVFNRQYNVYIAY